MVAFQRLWGLDLAIQAERSGTFYFFHVPKRGNIEYLEKRMKRGGLCSLTPLA